MNEIYLNLGYIVKKAQLSQELRNALIGSGAIGIPSAIYGYATAGDNESPTARALKYGLGGGLAGGMGGYFGTKLYNRYNTPVADKPSVSSQSTATPTRSEPVTQPVAKSEAKPIETPVVKPVEVPVARPVEKPIEAPVAKDFREDIRPALKEDVLSVDPKSGVFDIAKKFDNPNDEDVKAASIFFSQYIDPNTGLLDQIKITNLEPDTIKYLQSLETIQGALYSKYIQEMADNGRSNIVPLWMPDQAQVKYDIGQLNDFKR